MNRSFATALLGWYSIARRDLPWRATRDPYRIWVSEIMLQQTRASAVIPYYHRFLERFPNLQSLATASEEEVLACWSGLGYYSRARNLQGAARRIVRDGAFPSTLEAIERLPGVGPYTAAAIASIAFDLPHAVLDGNVMRVIARLWNDASDIKSSRTRVRFQQIADILLDRKHPGQFNQAIMELGATVCLPRAPECARCPVSGHCRARHRGTQNQLPVRLRTLPKIQLNEALVIVERNGAVLLSRRPADSTRMAGFWELPDPEELRGLHRAERTGSFRHTITCHQYIVTVFRAKIRGRVPPRFCWFTGSELGRIPLTTASRKALALGRSQ